MLLQIAAPVGTVLAMGAQTGLLAAAPICSEHRDSRQTDRPDRHDTACPLCHVCCTAQHILAATPAAELPVSLLAAYVERGKGQPGLPRGPPNDAPNARAPPLS